MALTPNDQLRQVIAWEASIRKIMDTIGSRPGISSAQRRSLAEAVYEAQSEVEDTVGAMMQSTKIKVNVLKKRNVQFPWGGWVEDEVERDLNPDQQKKNQREQQRSGTGNQQGPGSGTSRQTIKKGQAKTPQQGQGQGQGQSQQSKGDSSKSDKGGDSSSQGSGQKKGGQQSHDQGGQGSGKDAAQKSKPDAGQGQDQGEDQGEGGSPQHDGGSSPQDGSDGQGSGNSDSGSGNESDSSSQDSQGPGGQSAGKGYDGSPDSWRGDGELSPEHADGTTEADLETDGISEESDEKSLIDTVRARFIDMGVSVESFGDHRIETYDSLDAFIENACDVDEERSVWGNRASRDTGEKAEHYSGTATFEEAVDLARVGWPEGVLRLDQIADHYHQLSKWTIDKSRHLDVAGTYPIVPIFLGGDPACMVNDGELNRGVKPLLHIVVNRGYSWMTPAERIFNFGAALMVCIDQIETYGVRVELTVGTANIGDLFGPVQERPVWATMTTVKRPQEHLEKNRLAFALAHPAYGRRLKYSLLEQVNDYEQPFHWGYGKPIALPHDLIEPGAVYIPQLEAWQTKGSDYSPWDDISTAVGLMQQRLGIIAREDGRIELENPPEVA